MSVKAHLSSINYFSCLKDNIFLIYYIQDIQVMTEYKEKYLKYKNKYINLKKSNQDGGVIQIDQNPDKPETFSFKEEEWKFIDNPDNLESINFNKIERDYIIDIFIKQILPKILKLDPCIVEKDIKFLNFGTNGAVIYIGKYAIKIIKFNDEILPTLFHELVSLKLIKQLKEVKKDSEYSNNIMEYFFSLIVDFNDSILTYNINPYSDASKDELELYKLELYKNEKFKIISDSREINELLSLDDVSYESGKKRLRISNGETDVDLDGKSDDIALNIENVKLCFMVSEKNDIDLNTEIIYSKNKSEIVLAFIKDSISALLFLFDNQLIHFDFKIENFIMNRNPIVIKFIDFATLLPFNKVKRNIFYKVKFVTTVISSNYSELINKHRPIFDFAKFVNPDYDWCALFSEIYRLLSILKFQLYDNYLAIYKILKSIQAKKPELFNMEVFKTQIESIRTIHRLL
jgi:serine/threonine protein kinase